MRRKKKLYIVLGIIQLVIAIGAIPAGIGFLIDTTGTGNGTSPEILKDSPFSSFLIPGLFLLIVHGIGNVIGAVLSFFKSNYAGHAGIFFGTAQIIWISVQVYWIGLSSFLQPTFFVIGILEAAFGLAIFRNLKKDVLPKN